MGRAKQSVQAPSVIAKDKALEWVATQGLLTAYWIAEATYHQVRNQVARQIEKHPDEWGKQIKAEIKKPPPPPLVL